ncbi:MAG: hypothetical protein ACRDY1_08890 [Acidimicrobiales bacterium]
MKFSRSHAVLGAVALVAVLLCAACSSGPSGPSLSAVQAQLQTIVKNTDKALAQDTVQGQLVESNAKYAVAFATAARSFKALNVPVAARHDRNVLAADLQGMAEQAEKVSLAAAKDQSVEANVLAYGKANLKLMEDETAEKKASNTLRKAIGLPPETTTTTTSQPPAVLSTTTTTTAPAS